MKQSMHHDRMPTASTERLTGATSQPSPLPPPRAHTVTNNLSAAVTAGGVAGGGGGLGAMVKDTNVRGSMDGVETVRVTDMTASSAFTKSIGSLFSTINKSVSSAFSSLMAVPPPLPATGVETSGDGSVTAKTPLNSASGVTGVSGAGDGDPVPMSMFGVGQTASAGPTTSTTAAGVANARQYAPVVAQGGRQGAPDQSRDMTLQQDIRIHNQQVHQQQQQQQQQPNFNHRGIHARGHGDVDV